MSEDSSDREPLPIWVFVGLILVVYGVLVAGSGLTGTAHTVLAHTRPGLWWGAIMTVGGVIFLAIGWRSHAQTKPRSPRSPSSTPPTP